VKQVRFNPKRAMVAVVGGNDREVKTWDLKNNQNFVAQIKLQEQLPEPPSIGRPDGNTLAVGLYQREVRTYDLTGKPAHRRFRRSLSQSPNG